MGLLSTVKEFVFAETADPGKVALIMWRQDKTTGVASILVPVAAYDRAPHRAALRAVNIKIPEAIKVTSVKREPNVVKYPQANYYLVRAEFATNK